MTPSRGVLLFLAVASIAPDLRAQVWAGALVGDRQYLYGSKEAWPALELRLGIGARLLRAELGAAAATRAGGSETEGTVGIGGAVREVRRRYGWFGTWGLGYSRLHADRPAGTGSSHAGYGRVGVRWALSARWNVGVDLRFLAGPDRLHRDGSTQPVTFLQLGTVFEWGPHVAAIR